MSPVHPQSTTIAAPQGTLPSSSLLAIPHWDPGIHTTQVRPGWAGGPARTPPHLEGLAPAGASSLC